MPVRSGVRGASGARRDRAGRPARSARARRRRRWRCATSRSARPNWATAAAESPPPITENARLSATASATARVPASNRGSSNTPIGPFHRTVRASPMMSPNSAAAAGADVEAHPAVGQRPTEVAHLATGGRIADLPAGAQPDDVGGQVQPVAVLVEQAAHSCRSGRARTASCRSEWPIAAKNVKHMPPPMMIESAMSSSAVSTPSLSDTLDPPVMATNGSRRVARARPSSTSTSLASSRPAAEGSLVGGPTMEACARCEAPKASFTYRS